MTRAGRSAASNAGDTDTYTCTFTAKCRRVSGSTHVDVVTVVVTDDDDVTATDNDDATVTRTGVAPTVTVDKTANPTTVSEFGGPVTYTVVVTNTSAESVTLTSLVDDQFGNLDQDDVGNHSWTSSTCDTGGRSAASNAGDTDTYTCTFTANVPAGAPGSTHVDVVTVVVTDDDDVTATDNDDATVTRTGVAPTVTVDKTANPTTVSEFGGPVTYTVVVTNTSAESVTLTSLVDDQFGNLDQDDVGNHSWTSSTCDTGGTLAARTRATRTRTRARSWRMCRRVLRARRTSMWSRWS